MKKLLAAALAGACVLSMSVTSFAWGNTGETLELDAFTVGTSAAAGGVASYEDGSWNILPDKTLYFILGGDVIGAVDGFGGLSFSDVAGVNPLDLINKDLFKFSFKKDAGAAMVKSVALVEKSITIGGTSYRLPTIEVKLNDDYTDKETKVKLTFTFSATSKAKTASGTAITSGAKTAQSVTFWVSNAGISGSDYAIAAGTGGVMIKPDKNESNEYTWEDNNNTIAKLNFDADDDVAKLFPKLSTKWDNATYAARFAGQDAFIRKFVSNPKISSTSRATLTLYNPYVDEDGDVTVDVENVVIYEEIDGELKDVTKNFTATTDDNGDSVFTTKTRALGTYIIAEAAANEAGDATDAPTTEGGKEVPNTGR